MKFDSIGQFAMVYIIVVMIILPLSVWLYLKASNAVKARIQKMRAKKARRIAAQERVNAYLMSREAER